MPKLRSVPVFIFFPVDESAVSGDYYCGQGSGNFLSECLEKELQKYGKHLFGKAIGQHYKITDEVVDGYGNIHLDFGTSLLNNENDLIVPDIRNKIIDGFDNVDYYVFVNRDRSRHAWVAVEQSGVVYRG